MKELLNTLAAGDVNLADYKAIRMDISYSYSKVYKQLGLAFKESWQDDNLMLGTANDFLISIVKYILEENIKARDVLIDIHPCWVKYITKIVNNPSCNATSFEQRIKGFNYTEELLGILKDLKLYVPIWNTHNSVVKTMVCIN